jgi:hypothetical protein
MPVPVTLPTGVTEILTAISPPLTEEELQDLIDSLGEDIEDVRRLLVARAALGIVILMLPAM